MINASIESNILWGISAHTYYRQFSDTRNFFLCINNSEGSTLVEDACQILIDNNISSAPVLDATQSRSPTSGIERRKSYIGMFDYGDLITYVLIVLKRSNVSLSDDDDASLEIKEIVKRAVAGQSVPVRLASGK